jgi:hypothetical protein
LLSRLEGIANQASCASLYSWKIAWGSLNRNAGTTIIFTVVMVVGLVAEGDTIRVVVCVVVRTIVSNSIEDTDKDDGGSERVDVRVSVCVTVEVWGRSLQ